jgi:Sec-independent protein translocase protein TatA
MLHGVSMLRVGEVIVLLFVLIVVFSASRMGALGNALGKFIYSFRRAARGQDLVDANKRSFQPGANKNPREEDAQLLEDPKGR